jgi:digeranylgeranylglycerophospholipid reductase
LNKELIGVFMKDVIVIGAGPAGSTAAKIVAQSGFDVQLIEKRKIGETKPCGGGISKALAIKLALNNQIVESAVSRVIYHFPWSIETCSLNHVTVLRENFDMFLIDKAINCGAKALFESIAVSVHRKGTVMEVEIKNLKTGEMFSLFSKMIIFADGPSSLSAKMFPGVGFLGSPSNLALAARYELECKNNDINYYEFFYGQDLSSWGYAWIFPTKNSLNVGVFSLLSKLEQSRTKITDILNYFLRNRHMSSEKLRHKPILDLKVALIPLAPAKKIFGPACLVVGDAAGMVNPLTSSGIVHAVSAGELAGRVAVEALHRNDLSEKRLSKYQALWERFPNFLAIKQNYQITRALLPVSRIDGNSFAKISYLLHFGRSSLKNPRWIL